MATPKVTAEFDRRSFMKLAEKLDGEMVDKATQAGLESAGIWAEGRIKEYTPRVEGEAKRKTQVNFANIVKRGEVVVALKYPYAHWLETGRNERFGYTMRVKVDGYKMIEKTTNEWPDMSKKLLDKIAKAILKSWSK